MLVKFAFASCDDMEEDLLIGGGGLEVADGFSSDSDKHEWLSLNLSLTVALFAFIAVWLAFQWLLYELAALVPKFFINDRRIINYFIL